MNSIVSHIQSFWSRLKKIKHTPESSVEQSKTQEYVTNLENKLVNVLSKVKGAGDVNVVITLEKGFEYQYVTEEEIRTNADGSTVKTEKAVLVNGEPVLEREIYPVIRGIVITASGADNLTVKMNILSAIQTVIDVDNITILTGK